MNFPRIPQPRVFSSLGIIRPAAFTFVDCRRRQLNFSRCRRDVCTGPSTQHQTRGSERVWQLDERMQALTRALTRDRRNAVSSVPGMTFRHFFGWTETGSDVCENVETTAGQKCRVQRKTRVKSRRDAALYVLIASLSLLRPQLLSYVQYITCHYPRRRLTRGTVVTSVRLCVCVCFSARHLKNRSS